VLHGVASLCVTFPKDSKGLRYLAFIPCDTNATWQWPDVLILFLRWGAEVWWVFEAKTPSEEGGLSDVVASNTTAARNVAAANVIFGALH
jgi:hypothetical protein